MIAALAGLLACQLVGEVIVRALSLPLPGPVGGLAMMFAWLVWRGRRQDDSIPEDLGRVADAFMRNLSILFVPAAVGIVQYLGLLWRFVGSIALTIAVSTTAALLVTVLTFRLATRLQADRGKPPAHDVAVATDAEHRP